MPYVDKSIRSVLDQGKKLPVTPGELNFVLAGHIDRYLGVRPQSYQVYNDVIGVLECLKLEVYRRLVAPYEDEKLAQNGDVFSQGVPD
jgi:hypothetical protein